MEILYGICTKGLTSQNLCQKRRKLYDLYGEAGLSSGLEVGAHLKTHDQVREEYLRQMTKKNQKRLEAKLGVSGVLQVRALCACVLGVHACMLGARACVRDAGRRGGVRAAGVGGVRRAEREGARAPHAPSANGVRAQARTFVPFDLENAHAPEIFKKL